MRVLTIALMIVTTGLIAQTRLTNLQDDIYESVDPYGEFGVVDYHQIAQIDDVYYALAELNTLQADLRRIDLATGERSTWTIPNRCGDLAYHITDDAIYIYDDRSCHRWDMGADEVRQIWDDTDRRFTSLQGLGDLLLGQVHRSGEWYSFDANTFSWQLLPITAPSLKVVAGFSAETPFAAASGQLYNVLTGQLLSDNYPSGTARSQLVASEAASVRYITTSTQLVAYDLNDLEVKQALDLTRTSYLQYQTSDSLYLYTRSGPLFAVSKATFERTEIPFSALGIPLSSPRPIGAVVDNEGRQFYYDYSCSAIIDTVSTSAEFFIYHDHVIEVIADEELIRILFADPSQPDLTIQVADLAVPSWHVNSHPYYGVISNGVAQPFLIGSQGRVDLPTHSMHESLIVARSYKVGERPQFLIGHQYVVLDGEEDYLVVDLAGLDPWKVVAVLEDYIVYNAGQFLEIYSRQGDVLDTTPSPAVHGIEFVDDQMLVRTSTGVISYLDGQSGPFVIDGEPVLEVSNRLVVEEQIYCLLKTDSRDMLARYVDGSFELVYTYPDNLNISVLGARVSPCGIVLRHTVQGLPNYLLMDLATTSLVETAAVSPYHDGRCFYLDGKVAASYAVSDLTDVETHLDLSDLLTSGTTIDKVTAEAVYYRDFDGMFLFDGAPVSIDSSIRFGVTYTTNGSRRVLPLEKGIAIYRPSTHCSGNQLYMLDYGSSDLQLVDGIWPDDNAALFRLDTMMYFSAYSETGGNELWRSDGSASGTVPLRDLTGDALSSLPSGMVFDKVSQRVYFRAQTKDHRHQVWYFDPSDDSISSIEDLLSTNQPGLQVTPNPSSDLITISGLDTESTVTILDVTGRVIEVTTDNTIDVSTFRQGIYFATASTREGLVTTRFIVAR